jgi:hypothetical protein
MGELTVSHCVDWLRTHLAAFPVLEVSNAYKAGRRNGFSRRLVRAAKNQLGLVVTSQDANGKRVFYWQLS